MPQWIRHALRSDLVRCALVVFGCTALSMVFSLRGIYQENIVMVYLIGVLLVIVDTKSFVWGSLVSAICVLAINFFFAFPYFSFRINDPNDVVTFFIFLIVCVIASTLTSKLQRQIQISKNNEKQTNSLYQISRGFLNISGIPQIAAYSLGVLKDLPHCHFCLYAADFKGQLSDPYWDETSSSQEIPPPSQEQVLQCFSQDQINGFSTSWFSDSPWRCFPVGGSSSVLGVLGVYCPTGVLPSEYLSFLQTVISQTASALERENLYTRQEEIRIDAEREKLRNTLLRSLSHDLRTPLTSMAGSTSFLMESLDHLDRETILSLLGDLSQDIAWLSNLIENLLNMTRIQDGKLLLQKQPEVVDDLIAVANSRVQKLLEHRTLTIKNSEEILLVLVDGKLITQVLINLLNNAIQHTPDGCHIWVSVYPQGERVYFEVSDNGGGIRPEVADHIFESFVTSSGESGDHHRGVGLGLSICKNIIQAHGGAIEAFNNPTGGATFRFWLPGEKAEE